MQDIKHTIKTFLDKALCFSPVIIEAGAADGRDTLEFSTMFPSGKIHAFEPIKEMYSKAKNLLENRHNVILNHAALGNSSTKIKMHVSDRYGESWGSHSILAPKLHIKNHPSITFKNQEEVDSVILDDYLKKHEIKSIDFMWLDMQGYESVALAASPYALSVTKYLYTEISLQELYEGTMLYPEYKNFLSFFGFYPIIEEILWADGGNVLFKNVKIT